MTTKNIYLCGFMGSGKTTTGKILARVTGKKFLDTDAAVENKLKTSLPLIFGADGKKFRAAETSVLAQAARRHNLVVALGGGTLLKPANRDLIKETGILIYLKCAKTILRRRLRRDSKDRPLLSGYKGTALTERINALLLRREEHYRQAGLTLVCSALTPARAAAAIKKKLRLQ